MPVNLRIQKKKREKKGVAGKEDKTFPRREESQGKEEECPEKKNLTQRAPSKREKKRDLKDLKRRFYRQSTAEGGDHGVFKKKKNSNEEKESSKEAGGLKSCHPESRREEEG